MSNIFGLADNQNVTVTIGFADSVGNVVPDAIDAGSLTAHINGTELTATPSADQTSVLITATGPLTADDTLTVACTVAGAQFSGTEDFSVGASAPTSLTLTPGAPVNN